MCSSAQRGFSLAEVLVSMAVGLLVMGCAVSLFKQSMDSAWLINQKSEMQQGARAAINAITADLSIAGTGMPYGGVTLPNGSKSSAVHYGCSGTACYINAGNGGTLASGQLTPVIPGHDSGAITDDTTDTLTLVYVDYSSSLSQYPLKSITPSGSQITVDPRTSPGLGDPAVGINTGDLIILSNSNGAAVGVATNVTPNSGKIDFANSDPLNINQPSAAFGNIASIGQGGYPPTTAARLLMVTYYIDTATGTPRLMRQVNAHNPIPVADNIENLQISYDILNSGDGTFTANLPDAGGMPAMIKNIHVTVTARSHDRGRLNNSQSNNDYIRLSVGTNIAPRNLSFHDTYN